MTVCIWALSVRTVLEFHHGAATCLNSNIIMFVAWVKNCKVEQQQLLRTCVSWRINLPLAERKGSSNTTNHVQSSIKKILPLKKEAANEKDLRKEEMVRNTRAPEIPTYVEEDSQSRLPLKFCVANVSYELLEEEYAENQRLVHAVETNSGWLQPLMTSNNYDSFFVPGLCSYTDTQSSSSYSDNRQRDSGYDGRSEITAYCGNMNLLYEWNLLWRIASLR
ncbi:hypothetical protein Tco_0411498 [Tanacetum coccineum]